jgi:hypothetical protein
MPAAALPPDNGKHLPCSLAGKTTPDCEKVACIKMFIGTLSKFQSFKQTMEYKELTVN